MIRRLVIGVDSDRSEDIGAFRKFIANWNERNDVPYKDGALITHVGSPVAEEFVTAVESFNYKEGTTLAVTRRIDIRYERADIDEAEWLHFCINGYAGVGSRELVDDSYTESKCPDCGYRESVRQVRPLVVSRREIKKKDFAHTSHLELLVSERARSILQKYCGDEVAFRSVDYLGRSGSREELPRYSQLQCKVLGGCFSPTMPINLGNKCVKCGRENSRTTGGAPLLVERDSLPENPMFHLDEGLGSSSLVPSRSRPLIITKNLFMKLKEHRLSGYYVQPILTSD